MPKGNHLARVNAPKSWPVERKTLQWIIAPKCGPHSYARSIPLKVLLTEMLGYAKTAKEAKKILREKQIFVNKTARNDLKFPVGVMDILEVPATKEQFRILLDKKGRLTPHKITEEEANVRPAKITGKQVVKGKKVQLKLFDGTTMRVDKGDYKVGDTILIDTGNKTIRDHFKFEKGATVYIIGGKQSGKTGILEEVRRFKNVQPDNVIINTKEGAVETRKSYAFVIGREASSISLPEK